MCRNQWEDGGNQILKQREITGIFLSWICLLNFHNEAALQELSLGVKMMESGEIYESA